MFVKYEQINDFVLIYKILGYLCKKALIEEKIRTILKTWRSTQEAEGVALEMR